MSPIVLFDKSFLHSLSVDEAAVFDVLFMSNITPLFFIETLADLRKKMSDGRTPEQVVGNLALKTPKMHSSPNMLHTSVAVAELTGHPIDMRGVPVVAGGRAVRSGGKDGIIFDHPPEMQALHRWEDREFLEVERDFAADWRTTVQNAPRGVEKLLGPDGKTLRLSSLQAVADTVDELLDSPATWVPLRACMEMFGLRLKQRDQLKDRWLRAGRPRLRDYAPYSAHVLRVEMIFHLGVATGQLHDDRPSNRVDLAYLHYLPFCGVFVSGDKLHRRLAPVFLKADQRFVWAHDLKADLTRLVAHYADHPEIGTEGLFRVARYPPRDGDYLVTQLYDGLRPGWRKHADAAPIQLPPEKHTELVQQMNAMKSAPEIARGAMAIPPARGVRDADHVTYERRVPLKWGRWQFMPADLKADC